MLNNDVHYLTAEGLEQLEKRFRYLTVVRREELAEQLRSVLEEGGELTESSEYESTKNEQGLLEGEIARLEDILNRVEIIENPDGTDVVSLGSRVTVVDKETKETEEYLIVGAAEANPVEGKISYLSPAGSALLGKKKGDKVTYKAPGGQIEFKIKKIA